MNRRTFFAASAAMASLPTSDIYGKNGNLIFEDNPFVSYSAHVKRVGEMQALRDLREEMFPISKDRFTIIKDKQPNSVDRSKNTEPSPARQIISRLHSEYGSASMKDPNKRTLRFYGEGLDRFCHAWNHYHHRSGFIRDWWLWVIDRPGGKVSLRICHYTNVYVSIKILENSWPQLMLRRHIASSLYRNYAHRQRSLDRENLVRVVNRQIMNSIRTLAFPRSSDESKT